MRINGTTSSYLPCSIYTQLNDFVFILEKIERLRKTEIAKLDLREDTLGRLKSAGFTHLVHLPYRKEDKWWLQTTSDGTLQQSELNKLKNRLFEYGMFIFQFSCRFYGIDLPISSIKKHIQKSNLHIIQRVNIMSYRVNYTTYFLFKF